MYKLTNAKLSVSDCKNLTIEYNESPTVYIASKKYKIVCMAGCFHVANIKASNKVCYSSLDDAIKDGCRPCKHCLGVNV